MRSLLPRSRSAPRGLREKWWLFDCRSAVGGQRTLRFPVAPHGCVGTLPASIVEEVAANLLHCSSVAGGPHPGSGRQFRSPDGGHQCLTRIRSRREVAPLHRRPRMVGKREPGIRMGHLDQHVRRRLGRKGLQQLTNGGDGGLVTGEQKGGCVRVDGIAPTGTRDGCGVACPCPQRPVGNRASLVDDDIERESWSSPPMTGRGVKVRISARRPSGRRNSLPFQIGITRSRVSGGGSSNRTLAAG